MHKLLCEQPRVGRHSRCAGGSVYKNQKTENLPTKESMKNSKAWGGYDKSFGDHLKPLYRWIHKQVGRKWNDVYAEIVRCTPKGMHRNHVIEHVFAWVTLYRLLNKDGEINSYKYKPRYYVDHDGILKEREILHTRRYYTIRDKESIKHIKLDDGQFAMKQNGIWFILNMATTSNLFLEYPFEVEDQCYGITSIRSLHFYYGSKVYCKSKKHMTKKEMKKNKLHNN